MKSAVTVLSSFRALDPAKNRCGLYLEPAKIMIHDNSNSTGAASASAPEPPRDVSADVPPSPLETVSPSPENIPQPPIAPQSPSRLDPAIPEDLRTPWGWKDLFLFIGFVFLGLLISAVIVVGVAVLAFGMPMSELNQTSAKSVVA